MKRAFVTLSKSLGLSAAAMIISLGATGCGVQNPNYASPASYNVSSVSASSTSLGANGEFTCPSQANIEPEYDRNLDGSGKYTVCPSSKNIYTILIHGKTHASNSICVFPTQSMSNGTIWWKSDANGQPMFTCASATEGGISMTFDKTNFNYLYIVEQQDQLAMSLWLINHSNTEPNLSKGAFR